jgi:hypothetical protein
MCRARFACGLNPYEMRGEIGRPMTKAEDQNSIGNEVPDVPKRVLTTYSRLWQLETWLRRMVYVELRALSGDDWSQGLPASSTSFAADKRLTHMPTPEMNALSYAQLSKLQDLIAKHWDCFALYLPPQDIWTAKLAEVSQIRHRVAHFRAGHADDHQRVLQLLRDIDNGFWRFCTSYNDAQPVLPASDDSVVSQFLPYDPFPWTEVREKRWARIGVADPSLVIAVTVEVLRRPWAAWSQQVDGKAGHIYDVRLMARDRRYPTFLQSTRAFHSHLTHLCLDSSENMVRLTIPALLGSAKVIEIVDRALDVARHVVDRSRNPIAPTAEDLSDEWPEFVLGPAHPLSFLTPEMKCTFFNA